MRVISHTAHLPERMAAATAQILLNTEMIEPNHWHPATAEHRVKRCIEVDYSIRLTDEPLQPTVRHGCAYRIEYQFIVDFSRRGDATPDFFFAPMGKRRSVDQILHAHTLGKTGAVHLQIAHGRTDGECHVVAVERDIAQILRKNRIYTTVEKPTDHKKQACLHIMGERW